MIDENSAKNVPQGTAETFGCAVNLRRPIDPQISCLLT
jgi:hypothetical protein